MGSISKYKDKIHREIEKRKKSGSLGINAYLEGEFDSLYDERQKLILKLEKKKGGQKEKQKLAEVAEKLYLIVGLMKQYYKEEWKKVKEKLAEEKNKLAKYSNEQIKQNPTLAAKAASIAKLENIFDTLSGQLGSLDAIITNLEHERRTGEPITVSIKQQQYEFRQLMRQLEKEADNLSELKQIQDEMIDQLDLDQLLNDVRGVPQVTETSEKSAEVKEDEGFLQTLEDDLF